MIRRSPLWWRTLIDLRVGARRARLAPTPTFLKGDDMMQSSQPAMMLRIYTDEMALSGDHPLHEVVVSEARAAGLAGATVFKALDGFGRSAHRHTHHGHDLASDVPLVIEIVDAEENIRRFLPLLERLTEVGLITLTPLHVIRFGGPQKSEELSQ